MSVLQVLHFPDDRLRKIAPVATVNADVQRIVDDMFETMYAEEGIGLAATQVDIHQRIIVIDVSENRDERLVLINPELLEKAVKPALKRVASQSLNNVPSCRVRNGSKSVRRIVTVKVLSWKRMVCWQFAFSMKSTTWMASCLSIICRRSSVSALNRNWKSWPA